MAKNNLEKEKVAELRSSSTLRFARVIEEILREMEPYLASHGGGVELVEVNPVRDSKNQEKPQKDDISNGVKDFDIKLRVKGACFGCPFAPMTFNLGLEQTLRERIPQIRKIIYVE